MSDKMTCPGCGTHTSGVLDAYDKDEEMPCCGLSSGAVAEIINIRHRQADQALIDKAEAAVKRADTAEAETMGLRSDMSQIRELVREIDRVIGGEHHDYGNW